MLWDDVLNWAYFYEGTFKLIEILLLHYHCCILNYITKPRRPVKPNYLLKSWKMATSRRKGLLSSQNCSSPHWPHRLELLEPPRQGQPLLTQQGHVFFPPWLLRLSGHSQPVLLKVHKSIWSDRNKRGKTIIFFFQDLHCYNLLFRTGWLRR